MDRYDSWYAREHTTHQDQVLDLIKDYHYFAPAMLALSATQAQRRAEASLGRWEEPIAVTNRACLPMRDSADAPGRPPDSSRNPAARWPGRRTGRLHGDRYCDFPCGWVVPWRMAAVCSSEGDDRVIHRGCRRRALPGGPACRRSDGPPAAGGSSILGHQRTAH